MIKLNLKFLQKLCQSQELQEYFQALEKPEWEVMELVEKVHKDKKNFSKLLFETFQLTGLCKGFYENGAVKYEINYKDGKKYGVYKDFYQSGEVLHEVNYNDGERYEILKEYYKSGELWAERSVRDGLIHGVTRLYHKNGKLFSEQHFKDGKEHGIFQFYDQSGDLLISEFHYRDGVLLEQQRFRGRLYV
jgi:antitoxin component YwqK of YwqJK toxin-antitoxin module